MKTRILSAVLAVAMVALAGVYSPSISAQPADQTWSVSIHIEYPNGFVYDHAFATGVPASELSAYLKECGQSHRDQNWLRLHCYASLE